MLETVTDWGWVYDNTGNIPDGTSWPERWVGPARAFREAVEAEGRARMGLAYGPGSRNRLDLFMPMATPRGLVVYIHGGFWMQSDRSFWSHLAAGPLLHGFAVAVPEYSLCPTIRITGITAEIGAAITAAAGMVAGPIRLVGHSAGGHLASRMACMDAPLSPEMQARIAGVVSISGLHDLRPLLHVPQCAPLALDEAEALAESPALLRPAPGTRLTCWVGGAETSEFRRQSALLANIWLGLGAATEAVEEAGRHHFDIVDGLTDAGHPLVRTLLDLA
ncbi:MAG TPA: alpha/beta hydrolase [Paracoccus sp. (in: a-proteobacteria)]|uniref:alpha/beta hydrolase n=1 Tax=Paracoccus sp. TaxID=267 RepID=UPI002C1F8613|nr:alpha/beta hydrolase [Paracoccus sp. (in: a-proteobacteria)]HWL58382.1 alpha/beta hydrolase [Paracoccus sp. (in: a-proteobacteria)]